jgi:hypothetical protein
VKILLALTSIIIIACGGIQKEEKPAPKPITINDITLEETTHNRYDQLLATISIENTCLMNEKYKTFRLNVPVEGSIQDNRLAIGITPYGDIVAAYKSNGQKSIVAYICDRNDFNGTLKIKSDAYTFMAIDCQADYVSNLNLAIGLEYEEEDLELNFEQYHNPERGFISELCR